MRELVKLSMGTGEGEGTSRAFEAAENAITIIKLKEYRLMEIQEY